MIRVHGIAALEIRKEPSSQVGWPKRRNSSTIRAHPNVHAAERILIISMDLKISDSRKREWDAACQ
jgi:hypothetical protein